jgi:hypothetical protein
MLEDGVRPIGRGHRCLFVQKAIFVQRTIAAKPGQLLALSGPHRSPHVRSARCLTLSLRVEAALDVAPCAQMGWPSTMPRCARQIYGFAA